MRIGFDVSQTGRLKAGCGYFADSLACHLINADFENSYLLYPTFGNGFWDPGWPRSIRKWPERPNVSQGPGHRRFDDLEAFWLDPPVDFERLLGGPDVVHSNNFFCPTALARARLVYTLHDLAFVAQPEWTTEANWHTCFEGVVNASIYADHILAVSEYTRADFLRTFPHVQEERISVVYEASRYGSPRRISRPASLNRLRPGEFWLALGEHDPRKNIRRLVEAHARLRNAGETTYPLVLVGGAPRFGGRTGPSDNEWRLGYVEDQCLEWLYENCFAFCYPSLFEGFGLPVIEAMSLGAAVLTSDVTSLPEVVGAAGLLVDPTSVEAIHAGMRLLARNDGARDHFRAAGRERAKCFSWDATAARVLDIYRHVTSEYHPRVGAHSGRVERD